MNLKFLTEHSLEAAIIVVLVIATGWYFVIYDLQTAGVDDIKARIATMDDEIAEVESDLQRAASLRYEIDKYESEWENFTSSLVSTENTDIVLDRLRNQAEDYSVHILKSQFDFAPMLVKIGTDTPKPIADKAELILEGRGRFFAIGDFLEMLESEPVIADVKFVELAYQKAVDPEIYFKARMDIFVLNDLKENQ